MAHNQDIGDLYHLGESLSIWEARAFSWMTVNSRNIPALLHQEVNRLFNQEVLEDPYLDYTMALYHEFWQAVHDEGGSHLGFRELFDESQHTRCYHLLTQYRREPYLGNWQPRFRVMLRGIVSMSSVKLHSFKLMLREVSGVRRESELEGPCREIYFRVLAKAWE